MITKSSCGMKPSWKPFTGGALRSVLLNIFINDFDDRVESVIKSKFADDTKLRGVAHTQEGFAAAQRDLNRQEKWAEQNLRQFNKAQCRLLHLGRNRSTHQYLVGPSVCKEAVQQRGWGSWWIPS